MTEEYILSKGLDPSKLKYQTVMRNNGYGTKIYYDIKESLEYNNEIPFGLKDICGPCNILPLL